MKIPLIWLKDYLKIDKTPREIAASFTQLGLMLDKPLDQTGVLDLEHRMDRSDWLSIIGCARDLAAFENLPLKLPKPTSKLKQKTLSQPEIAIRVQTPHVRRFATKVFHQVKVGPSPRWLTERLLAYGIKSVNNIVDVTNFVMVEYGQPLHAQDLAKLPGQDITIRAACAGEKLTTILGTDIKLDSNVFILTSGGLPTVIGGIVGGVGTSVTQKTTDIILDAGNYDQRIIRQTSRRLKIINETVSHYDKYLDPRLIDPALSRATSLILELAGGTVTDNDDYYPHPPKPQTLTLHWSRLQLLSGLTLPKPTVKRILRALDYSIVEEDPSSLVVEIPYFRTDVEVEDDLIADILRINNYDNLPALALSTPIPPDITPELYRFEDRLRDLLVAKGAHEHITSSLTTASPDNHAITLLSATSSDQNTLRSSLVPSLQNVLGYYAKHGIKNIALFEIGKVFSQQGDKYLEHRHLSVVSTQKIADSLSTLMHVLGINYHISLTYQIVVKQKTVGAIGPHFYTLYPDLLLPLSQAYSPVVSEFLHSQSRDLSLLVPPRYVYADILAALNPLTLTYQTINCKSATPLGKVNNYLLTFTWPAKSNTSAEIKQILKTLKTALSIDSKS